MTSKMWIALALILATLNLSGCGVLLGAGAVAGADELKEREDGGDGLL